MLNVECLNIVEYHKKLVAAGVDAKLYVAKGTLHGFFHNPGMISKSFL